MTPPLIYAPPSSMITHMLQPAATHPYIPQLLSYHIYISTLTVTIEILWESHQCIHTLVIFTYTYALCSNKSNIYSLHSNISTIYSITIPLNLHTLHGNIHTLHSNIFIHTQYIHRYTQYTQKIIHSTKIYTDTYRYK